MTACDLCAGACCETMVVPTRDHEHARWLALRGTLTLGGVRVDVPCTKLDGGRCGIYEDRPRACREYRVGGTACLMAVRERRPERYAEIVALMGEG